MPQKLQWTPRNDARLLRLRHQGHGWDALSAQFGVTRNAVMERARRIGARMACRPRVWVVIEDPDRPPLPPGHPVCWAILTEGTVLADLPYPRPGPLGRERGSVIGE